jgi:hypothetical protein
VRPIPRPQSRFHCGNTPAISTIVSIACAPFSCCTTLVIPAVTNFPSTSEHTSGHHCAASCPHNLPLPIAVAFQIGAYVSVVGASGLAIYGAQGLDLLGNNLNPGD